MVKQVKPGFTNYQPRGLAKGMEKHFSKNWKSRNFSKNILQIFEKIINGNNRNFFNILSKLLEILKSFLKMSKNSELTIPLPYNHLFIYKFS